MKNILPGRYRTWVAVLAITVLGVGLRLHNISAYKFYPDSYQPLAVADSIRTYRSPVGALGPEGMVYPQFFSWTRPLYPLLINGVSQAWRVTDAGAAQAVAFGAGVLAIPLAGGVGYVLTRRRAGAVAGAGIVALSYGHTVWGGFVLTETIGVLLGLSVVAGLLLFGQMAARGGSRRMYWVACGVGLLLALATLARYEYALLLLPVLMYTVLRAGQNAYASALTVLVSYVSVIGVTFVALPLPPSSVRVVAGQSAQLLLLALLVTMALMVAYAQRHRLVRIAGRVSRRLRWLSGVALLLGIALAAYAPAVRYFALHDFVLVVLACAGSVLLLQRHRLLAAYCAATLLLLGAVYLETNQSMERYMVHLLPYLLPAAVMGAVHGTDRLRRNHWPWARSGLLAAAAVLVLQAALTFQGLRREYGPLWFTVGYEERAAQLLAQHIQDGDVVVAALPEPYYHVARHSTTSWPLAPPYADHLASYSADTTFVIVDDMALRDVFPGVHELVSQRLGEYRVASFYTQVPYRYRDETHREDSEVVVYRVKQCNILHALVQ